MPLLQWLSKSSDSIALQSGNMQNNNSQWELSNSSPPSTIWGSGLFFALALRPGGIRAPQIRGFCGSVAFWGDLASKRGIQGILPLWAPQKAIYHQYRVFYPCGLPKKPFGPLTGYFTPVCSSKSHLAPNTMVFTTVSTVLPQTDWKNWYFSPNAAN